MTPEDRAARKALLSLARWARKEAAASRALADAAKSSESAFSHSVWNGWMKAELGIAREAERRARRIGK